MTKPVTGQTTFGASTTGTTTQLDNNFLLAYNALNDYNTYANYLIDSGAANAMVVTVPANMTGALTDGLILQIKVKAVNTGATTLNYNGGGALNVTNIDGSVLAAGALPLNGYVQVQYSSGTTTWLLQTPMPAAASTAAKVSVRQSIQSAPFDANGFSTLIPASCSSLSLTSANITASAPLIVAAAGGFISSGANDLVGISSANLTWNCSANMVNYLGVTVAANGNLTAVVAGNANGVQPVYQWGGSNTNGNGNYTFNIQAMTMAVGNGSANAQTFTVFVGEANCNSNSVVTGTSYAAMGRYDSGYTATLPGSGVATSKSHNIGFPNGVVGLWGKCTTNDAGYLVGAELFGLTSSAGGTVGGAPAQSVNTRTTTFTATNTGSPWVVPHATTGAATALVLADWSYKVTVNRSW